MNKIFLISALMAMVLTSYTTALNDNGNTDNKTPSVVSRLDPVLRKALLQALSNLERNSSEDDTVDDNTTTTANDEILEESVTYDQTPTMQYHSYVIQPDDATNSDNDESEIIQTIIVKAPSPTVNSLDVDEVSEQNKNDVIVKFDKLDPVKDSDIRVETVQVARSVSSSIKSNEINGEKDEDNSDEIASTQSSKKVTTYKPSTTTTTTTEAPTHNEDGENIERVKENDVKIYQAPLVTAFTIQQDERGLPKNVIPLYKRDMVPVSMALPVEQFSFTSQINPTTQNFKNVPIPIENTLPPPTFSLQQLQQPQPPIFNLNTYALEQKQKQLEEQIVFLQEQQRKQEALFRRQQLYQDQQEQQRQSQLLLQQRSTIEEDYRIKQQKYEEDLKAYQHKQQSRFNQPSVVVEDTINQDENNKKTSVQIDKAQIKQQQFLDQEVTVQQLSAPQQQTQLQQIEVQQDNQQTNVQPLQRNVQGQHQPVVEFKIQNQNQQPTPQQIQQEQQNNELQKQIQRQNNDYRIKQLKYEEELAAYRQKFQFQQLAEQQQAQQQQAQQQQAQQQQAQQQQAQQQQAQQQLAQQQQAQQQQAQQQLFSRQQLPFIPAQQFAVPSQQNTFSQALPQQQQKIRFNSNNNQQQFRSNVQIVPSVQFQTFQVPTQQMLPIREPQTFRSQHNEFQQNIPQLSPVQELPQRSFQQFHTSGPIIHNSNIDPVITSDPEELQRNRVFRHETETANFINSINNNRVSLNPINNHADNYLQSLLFQSGISARQNEDLNIITKVLALNHGIPSSPNEQQNIRFPRQENV